MVAPTPCGEDRFALNATDETGVDVDGGGVGVVGGGGVTAMIGNACQASASG